MGRTVGPLLRLSGILGRIEEGGVVRWIIGDVHGCARELDRLLRAIRWDPSNDEVWFAGDLVRRGPDSLAVLRTFVDTGARGVVGNHDVHALLAHTGAVPRDLPELEPLFRAPDGEKLLAALRALPAVVRLPAAGEVGPVWLVHAGFHPSWSPDRPPVALEAPGPHEDGWYREDDVQVATRVRCCDRAGSLCRHTGPPETCPPPFEPWDVFYGGPDVVVHGHWAARGHHRTGRVIGLDSGCVWGGALTAWCQEEDRIVQVPSAG